MKDKAPLQKITRFNIQADSALPYPYKLPENHNFIEAVDKNDVPFMVVPMQEAVRPLLAWRQVMLILRHHEKDALMLLPTTDTDMIDNAKEAHIDTTDTAAPVQWGLLHDSVLAGESRDSAAQRLFYTIFGANNSAFPLIEYMQCIWTYTEHTALCKSAPMPPDIAKALPNTTLFLIDIGRGIEKYQEKIEHLWLDFDEIVGLAQHFSDMLSPTLRLLIEKSPLFDMCQNAPRSE